VDKRIVIHDTQELTERKHLINKTAERTTLALKELLYNKAGIGLLHDVRFLEIGQDPLRDRPLNFVEQLNQTFTYLTSLQATEYLMRVHKDHKPYILNLGTSPGFDIISEDGLVIAETFAATSPMSNEKLKKDCERVQNAIGVQYKYVFYYSPSNQDINRVKTKFPDVNIVRLHLELG
jgi:hypothetical protein